MLYKRVSGAGFARELRDLQVELIDRFGLLPDAAKNLMRIAAINWTHSGWESERSTRLTPLDTLISLLKRILTPPHLSSLVQNSAGTYRMQGAHRLKFQLQMCEAEARFKMVEKLLDTLQPGVAAATATV